MLSLFGLFHRFISFLVTGLIVLVIAHYVRWDGLTLAEHVGLQVERMTSQPLVDVGHYENKIRNWAKRMAAKAQRKASLNMDGNAGGKTQRLSTSAAAPQSQPVDGATDGTINATGDATINEEHESAELGAWLKGPARSGTPD